MPLTYIENKGAYVHELAPLLLAKGLELDQVPYDQHDLGLSGLGL